VRDAMANADAWFCCRVGYVETIRAVGLVAGERVVETVRREWPSFGIVEVDADLSEQAAKLALSTELRSLDALHLASALVLPATDLTLATWDRRLHAAAQARGLHVLPETLG
jgi:predicted nucleic acid-binding protein